MKMSLLIRWKNRFSSVNRTIKLVFRLKFFVVGVRGSGNMPIIIIIFYYTCVTAKHNRIIWFM